MLTVTLPSGKVYTYADRNASKANALAAKTGGTVTRTDAPRTYRCDCGRPTCGGCDDAMDARRDDNLTRYGIGWRRSYV